MIGFMLSAFGIAIILIVHDVENGMYGSAFLDIVLTGFCFMVFLAYYGDKDGTRTTRSDTKVYTCGSKKGADDKGI